MRLRLRLLWLLLTAPWRRRMRVLDEFVLSFTVLPNDIDISKLTDDRYLAVADLGRADLALRLGLAGALVRNKWVPLATFASLRFRHPLKLFQRYRLRTRVIYWDEKTFYLRHVFERGGRTLATGHVCATFLGPQGAVPPAAVLAEVGQSVKRPAMPEVVSRLQALESSVHAEQMDVRADNTLPQT